MKIQRLFHVLVVMGGASVAGGCESEGEREQRRDPAPDAAASSPEAGAELAPCFCDTQVCCDREAEPAQVQDGFSCCWSTTCP